MVLRKIACILLSFIMCISFVCCLFGSSVVFLLKNEDYWCKCADEVDFYTKAEENIEREIRAYSIPSGIPNYVFDEVVTVDKIENDLKMQISSIASSGTYSFDRGSLIKDFLSAFEKYATENNFEITGEVEEGLEGLAEYCVDEYVSYVVISDFTLVFGYIVDYADNVVKLMVIAGIIMIAAAAVLGFNQKKNMLGYLSYSFTGASLIGFIPLFVVKVLGMLGKFSFEPRYMYDYFVKLVENWMWFVSLIAIIIFVIGICGAIIDFVLKNKEM